MDALCDPRAFLSAQEKRAEQLKALGIEETDISKDVIQSKGPAGGGNINTHVTLMMCVGPFKIYVKLSWHFSDPPPFPCDIF
jgi:hypothetical protein